VRVRLQPGGSIQSAVHSPEHLIYRLNKIEALVGESPRDYEHAFALYLACLLDSIDPR